MKGEKEWSAQVSRCEKQIRQQGRWEAGCQDGLHAQGVVSRGSLCWWTTKEGSGPDLHGKVQTTDDRGGRRPVKGPGSGAALLAVVGLHHTVAGWDWTNPHQDRLMEPHYLEQKRP